MVPRLSAIIITRNEARNIGDCLEALAFCDERIVVDGGSDDGTPEIARAKGARVAAASVARGSGRRRTLRFRLPAAIGFFRSMPTSGSRPRWHRRSKVPWGGRASTAMQCRAVRASWAGRLRHSGWSPDYVLRLFRRGRGRFTDDLVHERIICDGPVGRLAEPLLHYPVIRLEDAVGRLDRYSTAGAEMLAASGRRVTFASGIAHGLWSFCALMCGASVFSMARKAFCSRSPMPRAPITAT